MSPLALMAFAFILSMSLKYFNISLFLSLSHNIYNHSNGKILIIEMSTIYGSCIYMEKQGSYYFFKSYVHMPHKNQKQRDSHLTSLKLIASIIFLVTIKEIKMKTHIVNIIIMLYIQYITCIVYYIVG